MMVSIQVSVSVFQLFSIDIILSIFANFMLDFNYVVFNHQKGGDCNEHGTIYAISSDFGDRMTTQHLD